MRKRSEEEGLGSAVCCADAVLAKRTAARGVSARVRIRTLPWSLDAATLLGESLLLARNLELHALAELERCGRGVECDLHREDARVARFGGVLRTEFARADLVRDFLHFSAPCFLPAFGVDDDRCADRDPCGVELVD